MTFEELLKSMTPEMHTAMKKAVELGKWPDGRRLSKEEKGTVLQAVIAYDHENITSTDRVGYIGERMNCKDDGSPAEQESTKRGPGGVQVFEG
ncbi:MAG: DUF1315 family protein [Motiliproteus sp.]